MKTELIRQTHEEFSWRPALLVLSGAGCLSLTAVLIKLAAIDPATSAFLRCAIAVLFLIPLARRESRRNGPLSRRGVMISVLAGIALGTDYVMWTRSIFDVGAGVATVLNNVQVIALPLLAWGIDRNRPPTRFALACPAMLFGILLVSGALENHAGATNVLPGTVFGVLSGATYAVYMYLTRRHAKVQSGLTATPLAWSTFSAAVTAAILSPLSSGLHLTSIPWASWCAMIALAVLGQVLAWIFVQSGSPHLAPNQTATLLLSQPVAALILSALILSEIPTLWQLTGAALTLVAVAVSNGVLPVSRPVRRD